MPLQLPLNKPGQPVQKLALSLNKGARFLLELYWASAHDLDAHALLATNSGAGAKISDLAQVLSAYNTVPNGGSIPLNPDKSFATPCGSLVHSGDSRTGVTKDIDETITIDGARVPAGVNEIPIFVTIHKAVEQGLTFAQVAKAGISIKDDSGKVLGTYELSQEFAGFNAVQMGSLVLENGGWKFAAVGSGFNGDFNTVLGHFS